ncbi:MAG TPA: hemerythrin domain-containing protein [Actinomycetota bacterium]|nr:hemerythrin domain-containing protein [Actinomycetota bacterium]
MDAIKLIKEDHEKFRKILKELEDTTERAVKTRERLFADLRRLLEPHEAMEEEIFYPALREKLKDDEIVLEGYEEHHAADVLLEELEAVAFDDESWGPKMKVIQENIEHHMEEEEGPMFSQARKVLGESELEELGLQMEERKSASARR